MYAAFYALAGALIGVLGSVLVDIIHERRGVKHRNQGELRIICSEFNSQVTRVRRNLGRLRHEPQNESIWELVEASFTEARSHHERLLITSELIATQEAARHVLHFIYWMIQAQRTHSNDLEECRVECNKWQRRLYIEVRRELGVKHPTNVYLERFYHSPRGIPSSGPILGKSEQNSEDSDGRMP